MDAQPLRYSDLVDIPVQESHEPLVNLLEWAPRVVCAPINQDILPYCANGILVRRTVAEKLDRVSSRLERKLPDGALQVVYGYRHPSIQERYYEEISTRIKKEHPDLPLDEVIERTHALIAVPSVAGHPTGGAIDVTILRNNFAVDMGTPIWDLTSTSRIPTFSSEVTQAQRENRLLLRGLLLEELFAPFDGEWWHFSFGDREWAAYHRQPHAIYSPIVLPTLA